MILGIITPPASTPLSQVTSSCIDSPGIACSGELGYIIFLTIVLSHLMDMLGMTDYLDRKHSPGKTYFLSFNQYNQPLGIALVGRVDVGILVAFYIHRLALIAGGRFVLLANEI